MTRQEFAQKYDIWESNPDFDAIYNQTGQGKVDPASLLGNGAASGPSTFGSVISPFAATYSRAKAYQKNQVFDSVEQQKADSLKPPPVDPRLQETVTKIHGVAKDFRNHIPQLADTFMGQIAEVNKKNLANEIDRTQKSYNQRGLLNSTARLGAEANDRERSAADLAQKRYDVNTQLNQEADQLDQNAIDAGVSMASYGQQVAGANTQFTDEFTKALLQKQQQQSNTFSNAASGLLGAAGYAGGYYGSSSKANGTSGGYQTTNPVNYGAGLDPKTAGLA
jgi:hypothetical protein